MCFADNSFQESELYFETLRTLLSSYMCLAMPLKKLENKLFPQLQLLTEAIPTATVIN
jgi:hypothetical protein